MKLKKVLKIALITLGILIAVLAVTPFLFKDKITTMVKNSLNESVNATIDFASVDLSLLKSFPKLHVGINDLSVVNMAPFEGDTLAFVETTQLKMSIKELFKKEGEAMSINSININKAQLNLVINADGVANYDITKTETSSESNSNESTLNIDLENYSISNSRLSYFDEESGMRLIIDELNHSGSGNFKGETSKLTTTSNALVSFIMGETNYLNKNKVTLDAVIGIDFGTSTYSFEDNSAYINNLLLKFDGFVQLLDEGQLIDISFSNPGASFKDFLALIPEAYSKNLNDVETNGDFKVSGVIKGLNSDERIPGFNIQMTSTNADFKYNSLPKAVEDISIDISVVNETGITAQTVVDVNAFNFKIDTDVFKSEAHLKNLTENMLVDAKLNGTINLANLTKAYPVELDQELNGILKAQISTAFDMEAVTNNRYERIKSSGDLNLLNFKYQPEGFADALRINTAALKFNPTTITLSNFDAVIGSTDMTLTGDIKNLFGFVLNNQELQGNFNINSNRFVVQDVLAKDNDTTTTATTDSAPFKIPQFLDCTLNANANTVIYDNLNLQNVSGQLRIKDQTVSLSNMKADIFKGLINFEGSVSTKEATPEFNMDLNLQNLDIAQSFAGLDLLKNIAPIAKVINGAFNSTLTLSGNLNSEMSPDLNTLTGNFIAAITQAQVNVPDNNALKLIDNQLNFVDFNDLNLKDSKFDMNFNNGVVDMKPVKFKIKDIEVDLNGGHSFSQAMNYKATFNVPAKYLGNEVNSLLSQLNSTEASNIVVPVVANVTGNIFKPEIKTDLSSSVTNLTKQLVEIKKQELLGDGKTKVNDLIGNLFGGATSKTDSITKPDSTKTNNVETTVKNVLGGFLNKKKKTKDTIQN
jgi:hypothetical protein